MSENTPRRGERMEHRWGARVALNLTVTVQVDNRTSALGVIRDASISGAFIESSLQLLSYAHVFITLHGAGGERLDARVVRRGPGGFAVEWRDMACPAIVALLERASGRRESELRGDPAFRHA